MAVKNRSPRAPRPGAMKLYVNTSATGRLPIFLYPSSFLTLFILPLVRVKSRLLCKSYFA